ncbi:protein of unknown function [Clostridium amylolyticum]|uniref:DUF4397 domain-containing protein n=2 Tax=Clostridium amylolyticum TaxID=1121298 RepID=A0A1M6BUJ5_9CLOT|nr:protein of unknown function [Clostridium amylolyticum]
MFYCPYYYQMLEDYYRAEQMNSYIRVFHASPNAPAVDVYANGNLLVRNLSYKEVSQYLPVPAGIYNIKVYPSGKMINPVINTTVSIPENSVFNVAAIGTLPNISLYPIPEPIMGKKSGRPCVRFVHLSPNAPAVDIRLADGTKVFNNVSYEGITDYACVPAGNYTFKVNIAGTDNTALTVPNVKLDNNTYYTIYAVGLVGNSPALEAVLLTEPR